MADKVTNVTNSARPANAAQQLTRGESSLQQYLFVVPHTHWDREWYLTFQQFRMKLVQTIDKLLAILDKDPAFTHFMLDGQTIVLEDYLEIRPEMENALRKHIASGRVDIGPWYLQPDEFLVGGEALIRNLLIGQQMGREFGGIMKVGYVPDCFGHIGQLPQILRGFGIDNAVFWRGVGREAEQSEFYWEGPDGSRVLVIHLLDSYGNAKLLPLQLDNFLERLKLIVEAIANHATTNNLLLMNGNDHLEAQDGLPLLLAEANTRLTNSRLLLSTLPAYIESIKGSIKPLKTLHGEMRSSQRAHLLPGVLSTRMWIKQANTRAETLLTRWAEPLSAFTWLLGSEYPAMLLAQSWKYLLHNQPHDSICGCSIDQVHREMTTRYAWSEQIAGQLTEDAMHVIVSRIATDRFRHLPAPITNQELMGENGSGPEPPQSGSGTAEATTVVMMDPTRFVHGPTLASESGIPLIVFNSSNTARTDIARCTVQLNASIEDFIIIDERGEAMPHQIENERREQLASVEMPKAIVLSMMSMVENGRVMDRTITEVVIKPTTKQDTMKVDVTVAEQGQPNLTAIETARTRIQELAKQDEIKLFHLTAHEAVRTTILFLARNVPANGYKTFFLKSARDQATHPNGTPFNTPKKLKISLTRLENEFYSIDISPDTGLLTVTDKHSGAVFNGLNHFVDGGDVGDLYNYCEPARDVEIVNPRQAPDITIHEQGPARYTIRIASLYDLPSRASLDRTARHYETVECAIVSSITLYRGVPRIDIKTQITNQACDHRLRVYFHTPINTNVAEAEGTFEVHTRPISAPRVKDWIEQPVATQPQKSFVDVSDGQIGLTLINRGLPEYEVLRLPAQPGVTIALTLLRCIEWLSRDDLSSREGHAGPMEYTPEAQCLGTSTFEYALVPHSGTWQDGQSMEQAHAYSIALRTMAAQSHSGTLPLAQSFVQVEPTCLVLSTIKRSEDGTGLIVRLYNSRLYPIEGVLTLFQPFQTARRVQLDESELRETIGTDESALEVISDRSVRVHLRGGEIQTIFFELLRNPAFLLR